LSNQLSDSHLMKSVSTHDISHHIKLVIKSLKCKNDVL